LDAANEAGDRFYPLYVLAISTGMREGELLGLKWQDINFDTGKLSVRRSLVITKKDGTGFSDTKRKKSRRSIKLSQSALEALKHHRKRQNEDRLRLGSGWQDNDLVFPGERGQAMKPWSLTGGPFKRALRRAGLPDNITFHEATRHTCATLLLSKGAHMKLVQELLGHASISITMDTYSHVLPGMDDGLADTMDEALA
jgi:integrase